MQLGRHHSRDSSQVSSRESSRPGSRDSSTGRGGRHSGTPSRDSSRVRRGATPIPPRFSVYHFSVAQSESRDNFSPPQSPSHSIELGRSKSSGTLASPISPKSPKSPKAAHSGLGAFSVQHWDGSDILSEEANANRNRDTIARSSLSPDGYRPMRLGLVTDVFRSLLAPLLVPERTALESYTEAGEAEGSPSLRRVTPLPLPAPAPVLLPVPEPTPLLVPEPTPLPLPVSLLTLQFRPSGRSRSQGHRRPRNTHTHSTFSSGMANPRAQSASASPFHVSHWADTSASFTITFTANSLGNVSPTFRSSSTGRSAMAPILVSARHLSRSSVGNGGSSGTGSSGRSSSDIGTGTSSSRPVVGTNQIPETLTPDTLIRWGSAE
jgi:hypothetical protein